MSQAAGKLPLPVWPLVSVTSISIGFTLGKDLDAGPGAVAALRLGIAAVLMLAALRPRLPAERSTLCWIAAWGTAQAGATTFMFHALTHLPVGVTVTLAFLGPLGLALVGSRRLRDVCWIGLAALGVVLLGGTGGVVSLAGVLLALAAGVCWGAHIALAGAVGQRTRGGSGLALALAWAALLAVPAGLIEAGPATFADPATLLGGLVVAVAASLVPYSADLAGRRRIPAAVYGVLVSLEPAVAALVGLLLLGEALALSEWVGIACVVAASIAITRA